MATKTAANKFLWTRRKLSFKTRLLTSFCRILIKSLDILSFNFGRRALAHNVLVKPSDGRMKPAQCIDLKYLGNNRWGLG